MVAWHGMDGLNTLKDQSTEITGRTISGNPMSRKKKVSFLIIYQFHGRIQEFLPGAVQARLPENSSDIVFSWAKCFMKMIM